MASKDDIKGAKQRFVALRVHEVSLVDRPANECDFLVIKRNDQPQSKENEMNAIEIEKAKQAEKDKAAAAEKEAAAKKAADEVEAEKAKKAADDAKAADEKAAAEKAAIKKSLEDELAAAEKVAKDAAAAVEAVKGKMPPWLKDKPTPGDETDPAKPAKTKKADEATPVAKGMNPKDMLIQMMCDDLIGRIYKMASLAAMDVEQLLATAKAGGATPETIAKMESVAKGKKQLSGERMEKLNSALKSLMEVAKDGDSVKLEATLKEMLSTLTGGEAPEKGGENSPKPPLPPTGGPDANGYSAQSAVKAIQDALTAASAEVAEVKKQLNDLQQAQAVSKALPIDDNATPVKKGESLWKGII